MKPFLVLIFFMFFIAMLVSGAIGDADLTPDTPPATAAPGSVNPSLVQGVQSGGGLCGNMYIVRAGDTLSGIARSCGVTLQDLLAVNPTITDPNVIRPDQAISIPAPALPTQAPVATAAQELPAAAPTATQAPAPSLEEQLNAIQTASAPQPHLAATSPPGIIPEHSVIPGEYLNVRVGGLPPSAEVRLAIGPAGGEPFLTGTFTTDPDGVLITTVTIPPDANPGEIWTITATSTADPSIQATAAPFAIE